MKYLRMDVTKHGRCRPGFLDQQQHIASVVYRQMHEKQQEHLQLSKFLKKTFINSDKQDKYFKLNIIVL